MARYITELANDIAKSCPDLVENGCGNDNCVACLSFKLIGLGYTKQPNTADVVPKSEVEKIFEEILTRCYNAQENADEVLAETGDGYWEGYMKSAQDAWKCVLELKKKYTESEDQG